MIGRKLLWESNDLPLPGAPDLKGLFSPADAYVRACLRSYLIDVSGFLFLVRYGGVRFGSE